MPPPIISLALFFPSETVSPPIISGSTVFYKYVMSPAPSPVDFDRKFGLCIHSKVDVDNTYT